MKLQENPSSGNHAVSCWQMKGQTGMMNRLTLFASSLWVLLKTHSTEELIHIQQWLWCFCLLSIYCSTPKLYIIFTTPEVYNL